MIAFLPQYLQQHYSCTLFPHRTCRKCAILFDVSFFHRLNIRHTCFELLPSVLHHFRFIFMLCISFSVAKVTFYAIIFISITAFPIFSHIFSYGNFSRAAALGASVFPIPLHFLQDIFQCRAFSVICY